MHYSKSYKSGFILPALVVFSLVLMSVGLVGIQYVASSTGSLQTTFYNNLAKEAANAGATFAYQCLRTAGNVDSVPWNGNKLTPNYDCNGRNDANPSNNIVNTSMPNTIEGDFQKGWLNETKGPSTVRTSFEVPAPSTSATNPTNPDISNSGTKVTAIGKVQFFYAGSTTPTRTIEQRTIVNIPIDLRTGNVPRAEGRAVTQMSSGMQFSCAVANQEMYCWGANNANQLGLSQCNAQSAYKGPTPTGNTAVDTTLAAFFLPFTMAANVIGGVVDVGCGAIAGVSSPWVNKPTRINTGVMTNKRVESVSASSLSGCAIIEGRAACWGANPHGQIGNGDKPDFLNTIQTMLYFASLLGNGIGQQLTIGMAVYMYNLGSQYLFPADDIYASGRYYPTYATGDLAGKNVSKISTSASDPTMVDRNTTCAISNGKVACWGDNRSGQQGQPTYANGSLNYNTSTQDCATRWATRTEKWLFLIPNGWNITSTGWNCTNDASYSAPVCVTGNAGSLVDQAYYTKTQTESDWSITHGGWKKNNLHSSTPTNVSTRQICKGTIKTVLSGTIFTDADRYAPEFVFGQGTHEGSQFGHLYGKRATDIATGSEQPCTVVDAGRVYCWGESSLFGTDSYLTTASSNTLKNIPSSTPITNVAGGYKTSCGIGSGKLYCWGDYRGNGTSGSTPIEISVPTSGVVLDNVYGFNDSSGAICATGNGDAYCWGKQLKWKGNGNQPTPELYGGAAGSSTRRGLPAGKITQMSPGAGGDSLGATITGFFTSVGAMCSVVNATPYCMGDNVLGQLGRGNNNNSTSGINSVNQFARTWMPAGTTSGTGDANTIGLTTGEAATHIDAGNKFTCAVINAQPFCWGTNTRGQLGDNTRNQKNQPTAASGVGSNYTTRVSAGNLHACSVTDGKAYCWGANDNGRIGNNTTTAGTDTLTPTQVTATIGSMAVTDISAGSEHTCAVANNQAYCWGLNGNGQLGDGTTTQRATPVLVPALAGKVVTKVTTGYRYSCAIADGLSYCWGLNGNGQLGDGTTTQRLVATPVSPANMTGTTTDIQAGYATACAIEGGITKCWGAGAGGQLGNGASTTSQATPVNVINGISSNDNSTSLGAGGSATNAAHGCALTGGYLRCWGTGTDGRLGNATSTTVNSGSLVTESSTDAFQLGPNNKPTTVTAGTDHSCAIANGKIFCWGNNSNGQLGDGTVASRNVPTATTTYSRNVREPAWSNTIFY